MFARPGCSSKGLVALEADRPAERISDNWIDGLNRNPFAIFLGEKTRRECNHGEIPMIHIARDESLVNASQKVSFTD